MENDHQQGKARPFDTYGIIGILLAMYSSSVSILGFAVFVGYPSVTIGRFAENHFFYIPLASIGALIFGMISLQRIKGKNYRGKMAAILSIVLGALALVSFLLLFLALFAGASLFKMI